MKDLANMLVGFIIGIPSLLWVLFMFIFVLVMFGMFGRMMFGPQPGQDSQYWTKRCGMKGDDVQTINDPDCPLALMFGEEFFGSVGISMFTCFRFMLGDYSSRAGVSISVTFAQEFGAGFMVAYVAWMIVVIFGLFNIITAIFVDTLTAGLKHNEEQRKRGQQYEHAFVRKKMVNVMNRISALNDTGILRLTDGPLDGAVCLTEEQFLLLVDDEQIQSLLADLDVEVDNVPGMYSTFDGDDRGKITLRELLDGVMKLRGVCHKADVIGCWVSTRMLHDKVDHLLSLSGGVVSNGRPPPRRMGDEPCKSSRRGAFCSIRDDEL